MAGPRDQLGPEPRDCGVIPVPPRRLIEQRADRIAPFREIGGILNYYYVLLAVGIPRAIRIAAFDAGLRCWR